MRRDGTDYLLICNTSDGLIAQLNGVGVQLQMARRIGLTPNVHLGRRSFMFGGPNPYYEEASGPNVWDYYYEPIGVPDAELQDLIAAGRVWTLSTASELARLNRWDPESWTTNPYGWWRSVENMADGPYPADWWAGQRARGRALLEDGTIRFRKRLLAEVDAFVAANFSTPTLGLQLRGSDKFDFGCGPNLSRKVLPEEYVPHVDRYLAAHPGAKIFVATDQRQWLKDIRAAYPDNVVSFSQFSLSDTDANSFNAGEKKAARGAEVVMDMLLLARCDYLIKCHSAVGEMALVKNGALPHVDLNYEAQPFTARPQPGKVAAAAAIRALAGAWKRRAEAGGALVRVVGAEGEDIQVEDAPGRAPRSLMTKPGVVEQAPRSPLLSRRWRSDATRLALSKLANRCYRYEAH